MRHHDSKLESFTKSADSETIRGVHGDSPTKLGMKMDADEYENKKSKLFFRIT